MSERDDILKAWVKRRDFGITQIGECKHMLDILKKLIEGDRSHNEAVAGDLTFQLRQMRTQLSTISHQIEEQPPDDRAPYLT